MRDVHDTSPEALLEELRRNIAGELGALESAYRSALEGATHAEARPENSKDTRALEQSYLARGQAVRVEALRGDVAVLDAFVKNKKKGETEGLIALGSVVCVKENETVAWLFVAPCGGGTLLAGETVRVITPGAPLGRALIGRMAGECIEARVGGQSRELEVISVQR